MEIKVFSIPTCPFCKKTKKFLNEKGIEFEDINVMEDEKGREEMVKKSGQMNVPVIEINKSGDAVIIVGFEKEKLEKELIGSRSK
jgi:glutaredoxin-like YruB-family protein